MRDWHPSHDATRCSKCQLGVRSGIERIGSGGEVLSYYQHIHGKPLVNGMIARVPSSVFEAYRASPPCFS